MRLFSNILACALLVQTRSLHFKRETYGIRIVQSLKMKKDAGTFKSMFPMYKPKSENQKKYLNTLMDTKTNLIFAVGPAGTGKTLLACNQAISDLKSGAISKIIITRPVVPVEEDIGFLPGNINNKMDPWMRPIFDIFLEFYSRRDIDLMLQSGTIEISPLAYMRGRTFKKAFIIADEMQNSSPNQMMMLTTRIGHGSRMVVTGDLKQSDKGTNSGLLDFINKFNVYEKLSSRKKHQYNSSEQQQEPDTNMGIKLIYLDKNDVERSPIVSRVLDIYDEEKVKRELESLNTISNNVTLPLSEAKNETIITLPKPGYRKQNSDAALIPLEHKKITEKYWWDQP